MTLDLRSSNPQILKSSDLLSLDQFSYALNRDRLGRSEPRTDRRGLKERVVDRLLGGFQHRFEQRRGGVGRQHLPIAWCRIVEPAAHLRRRRERDGEIAAAVAVRRS